MENQQGIILSALQGITEGRQWLQTVIITWSLTSVESHTLDILWKWKWNDN